MASPNTLYRRENEPKRVEHYLCYRAKEGGTILNESLTGTKYRIKVSGSMVRLAPKQLSRRDKIRTMGKARYTELRFNPEMTF